MIDKSVRSIILVLFIVVIFTVSLLIAYEGFQIPHDLRTNHMSITDVTSTCKQMDFILKSHSMSYEQMIRLINNDELNSYLTPQQIGVVEQCMHGKLPELSSYLTTQKLGFFEGLGNYKVSGKAKIIAIDQTNYLRFDYFDISYDSRVGKNFKIPELHVYLTQKNVLSPEIYLDKLKTKLGGKNYKLPDDVDLDLYNTVLIFDAIQKEPFAKIVLEDPFYVRDAINNILDDSKNIDHPKISSQIIHNRYGFLEGVDNYDAKGTMLIDYEEDEGDLTIKQFEVSRGEDLRLYLTKNGDVKKSGYWTLDSNGFVYISSATTNEVLRYSPSGEFVDVFVDSSRIKNPAGLLFGPDGNLYVSSATTNEVLRYSPSGEFVDVFVRSGSGGLSDPKDLEFGPDGNLYVSSATTNKVLRYSPSGEFVDVFVDSSRIKNPTGLLFGPDGNLYVSSATTNEVLRYSPSGEFVDVFVRSGSGGLSGPKDLEFSSNGKYLHVASFLTNEVLRYDTDGNFVDNFISSHNGQISNPRYAVFGPDDNLYVSTDKRILHFDGKSGEFVDVFVDSSRIKNPAGLLFGPDGNLYVSSATTNEVLRYSPSGEFVDVFVDSSRIKNPTGLLFGPDGNLYVSSATTNEVLRYSPSGEFVDVFVDSSRIKNPAGLLFGPDGNLYVASSLSDEIIRFDGISGQFIDVFASGGGLINPMDMSVDSVGFFYVSSSAPTNKVLRYSPSGEFVDVFVDSSRIKNPTGLLFGPDGNLYVVSSDTNEIIQYAIKNNIIFETRQFVTDASDALYQPTHLEIFDGKVCVNSFLTNDIHCYDEITGKSLGKLTVSFDRALVSVKNSIVGPDGELYASDSLRNEIARYDGVTGIFSEVVIDTDNEPLQSPSYIEFGPDGNLYVSSDDKVFRFNSDDGHFVDVFVSKNNAGMRNPQGLVFDENYLYVNSHDNNRVLRYHLNNGTFVDEFISNRDNGLLGPIGIALDKKTNTLYVGSSDNNQILRYDAQTGNFLNKINLPNVTPHGFVLDKNNTMYVNAFEENHVLSYDLDSKQSVLLLSGDDGLDGPRGLAFDAKNNILYISSYTNNKIFQYDVKDNSVNEITINAGNGILQKPLGLTLKEDILFISNQNNNEILKYDPENTTLDIFIYDTRDLIKPGGIAFGPNSYIYVINENDNGVYQYDVKTGSLLGIFAKPPPLDKDPENIELRSIVFTKDDKYMFLSNPSSNEVFAYDIKSKKYVDNFFERSDILSYPTGLTLTPDGEYLLIVNYGDNIISRFTTEGDFDRLFVNPTDDGLTELREMRFGHDGNLYIMGGTYGNIFRYDGVTGNYLGLYDTGMLYLGTLTENTLNHRYILNEIDTKQQDTVVVYDHLLERPYAQTVLQDYVDILSPIDIAWNSFTSTFHSISEPTLKSKEITKHTGFFIGMNDIDARGQVITKSVDFTSLITLENFSLDYDASKYISVQNSKNIFTPGPDLVACIVPNFSDLTCDNSNDSVDLGKIQTNAGENRYLLRDTNLDDYDVIVAYDKTAKKPFAHIPLRDYGTFRVSGESFLDWLQHDFAVIPILTVIMIIFPFIFDYTRAIFKILFFIIYFLSGKMKSKTPSPRSLIVSAKKISILIPAHNEEIGIRKSIESALATEYPNKEIIVIDDNSKDNTWNIANSFAEQGQIKLVSRPPAPSSKASALNHGMNFATGDYVLCMDGDTELDKDALKNAVPYFEDKDTVAFSGNVKILNGDGGVDNILTKLQTYEYMIAIELGRRFTSALQILLVVSGAFGIFKKDLIKEIHAFDKDTLTEDFDLTLKFRKTRNRIQFLPNSIAYTHCPATWSAWRQQRNRWAYGQLQTLSKNMDLLRNKFTKRDTISFVDMYVLDIVLSLLFPLGLAVLGIISLILFFNDTLHVLVYPMTFVMSVFVILEFITFVSTVAYSGRYGYLKLSYLVPVMTFFYRPYLRMVNLRGFIRAFYKKSSSW